MDFHILKNECGKHSHLIDQMHILRKRVFVDHLKWDYGLTVIGDKEYDEYDNENAIYLVQPNEKGEAVAGLRLMPTKQPYMIQKSYRDYLWNEECPTQDDIYEITRFCSKYTLPDSKERHKNIASAGQLTAAAIEYGLVKGISKYVALTNVSVYKMIMKVGWDPKPIGPTKITPDNLPSVVCEYSVSKEMLAHIRQKNSIDRDLVYEPTNPEKSIMEVWHEKGSKGSSLSQTGKGPFSIIPIQPCNTSYQFRYQLPGS